MISSIANLVYELPNDLRLGILGNIRKTWNLGGETWVPSLSSRILNFGNSSQNSRKSRNQFFFLSSFTWFLYFVPNILPRIVSANKILVVTWRILLQTLIFWHFVYYHSIYQILQEYIKTVSCVKLPTLMVLCKQYFAYLV